MFDEVCSPDCVSHDPAEPGDLMGIDAHKDRVRMYRTAMSDLRVSIDDIVATGDRVVMRWNARGTNDGELAGNAPVRQAARDHRDVDGPLRRERQARRDRDQWDNMGFMQQLGMIPDMAEAAG